MDTLPREQTPAAPDEPPYRLPSPLRQPGPGLPVVDLHRRQALGYGLVKPH